MIAVHPFRGDDKRDLKVMTWNVRCPEGADKERQKGIAELILKEDADFVLLNEYNQDSCLMIDSLLRTKYPFTEEEQSHQKSGDIFYCKLKMTNSGHVYIPVMGKTIQTIKATIVVFGDSVQMFGSHLASNRYDSHSTEQVKESNKEKVLLYEMYKESQTLRNFQVHWLKKSIKEATFPVIVMGDMNDFNCSAPLDTLTTCGLKDSWWEGGNGYGCTFHDGWMRLRIDHILHSKELKLESIKVIETDLSDHNPVVAGFSLRKN